MTLLSGVLAPAYMHIPDGFLSLPVVLLCWVLTAFFVGMALRRTRETLGERQVPLMGVLSATIFAAQMLNFPVVGGTSGHLIGSALAAIVLGPWAAVLVMTAVVALQALVFLDGGLLALGANILFMAVVGPWVSHAMYRLLLRVHRTAALFLAAWISVVVAATGVSMALWLSGTVALPIVLRAMVAVHALIGVGEGLITLGMVAFLERTLPSLSRAPVGETVGRAGQGWRVGLALAIMLALLSPLASPWPDGLERVAEDMGFMDRAREPLYHLLTDYTVPGVSHPVVSTLLAGVLGTVAVFLLGYALAHWLARSSHPRQAAPRSR